jgi:hypothetical protein
MTRILCLPLLALLCLAAPACQHAPPTASPQAQIAFTGTRAIKGLDLLRDFAIDGNAQTPSLISTATTRKIVTYHRSAITLVHDIPSGWKQTLSDGLDEVVTDLPPGEGPQLAPYVALVKSILVEVR